MPAVRPLQISDEDALLELFRRYPYKKYHQRFQRLDAEKLTTFFTNGEMGKLAQNLAKGQTAQWVAEENGQIVGLAGLQPDSWHSRFYPYTFARVAPFLAWEASPELQAELIGTLLATAKQEGFQHLMTRVDGAEYQVANALLEKGFFLVDASAKLSAHHKAIPDIAPPSRANGCRVRPFTPADAPAIARIAATSHPMNHFYQDSWLEHAGSDRLFEAWVQRCCDGLSSDIFILDKQGEVLGFVIYLRPNGLNKAVGSHLLILDFVCLDTRARGGGLGTWLISESLRELTGQYQVLELRTSTHNYPALACYNTLGMRSTSTDFILHRHHTR